VISPPDLQRLTDLHPTGRARCWGAVGIHDRDYAKMSTGDVVLFTGDNKVRAIGEVGVILRNEAFADRMWNPDPKNGSWLNIYSL
jgi:hypothetical protein